MFKSPPIRTTSLPLGVFSPPFVQQLASSGVQTKEVGITVEMLCVYCVIVKPTWKVEIFR
jgi:hypothetical protein